MADTPSLSTTFCDGLAHLLDLPPGSVDLDADLRTDLELDSFATITAVCLTEDITGREMPPDLAATVRTVGDLWAFCATRQPPTDLAHRIEITTTGFVGVLRPRRAP